MRLSLALVVPLPDYPILRIEKNATHRRIGAGSAEPCRRDGDGTPHRSDFSK
jgi:hypothetical protein